MISEAARGERQDAIEHVVEEELRPVVREAITEDTLRAIQDLVALTPEVVAALKEDIQSDDATIRQKAYSLVAKYTIGHPAVVKPNEDLDARQLVVNFELPRPGDVAPDAESTAIELEAQEYRQCDACGADKPITSFVAGSNRCASCHEKAQQKAQHILEATSEDRAK